MLTCRTHVTCCCCYVDTWLRAYIHHPHSPTMLTHPPHLSIHFTYTSPTSTFLTHPPRVHIHHSLITLHLCSLHMCMRRRLAGRGSQDAAAGADCGRHACAGASSASAHVRHAAGEHLHVPAAAAQHAWPHLRRLSYEVGGLLLQGPAAGDAAATTATTPTGCLLLLAACCRVMW